MGWHCRLGGCSIIVFLGFCHLQVLTAQSGYIGPERIRGEVLTAGVEALGFAHAEGGAAHAPLPEASGV